MTRMLRAAAVVCACMLSMSSAPHRGAPQFHHFQPPTHNSPWFNGAVVHCPLFLQHTEQSGLSERGQRVLLLYLNRFGSAQSINTASRDSAVVDAAVRVRWRLADDLLRVTTDDELAQWRTDMIRTLRTAASAFPSHEAMLLELIGVGDHERPELWATQTLPEERALAAGPPACEPGNADSVLPNAQTMLQRLQHETDEHGLLMVRVPLNQATTMTGFGGMIESLHAHATALSDRTRYGADALGMKRRVMLVLGPSSRPLSNAHTVSVGADVRAIHSPLPSLFHEWMHGVAALAAAHKQPWWKADSSEAPSRALAHIYSAVGTTEPTEQQWHVIRAQARVRSVAFVWEQWSRNVDHLVQQTPAINERATMGMFLDVDPSRYNAAMLAAHVHWMAQGHRDEGVSSWASRRRLVDRMLGHAQYRPDAGSVAVGYFSSPDELAASAFQADMNNHMGVAPMGSIMTAPLPMEVVLFKSSWDGFFEETRPWWDDLDPAPAS